ncbi:MAG: hypothetical protein LN568_01815 [Rickettsia endosymbiont of Pseudomimeciton antennatum]|nr:hypothetical protein [Rickettsia endosymbiont of Pseudomimeciton antennatum]
MVYLDNINKSGTFLKSKNSFSGDDQISLVGLVEGFAGFLGLIGAMIVFAALCKIIKCEMLGHDSNNANNAAEEFPLQQGIMNGLYQIIEIMI